jgi:hypothetical protein
MPDYQIHLNFLPIIEPLPRFHVFRKLRESAEEARPSPDVMNYRLPPSPSDQDDWPSYWVSLSPKDGYEHFETEFPVNPHLTSRILHHALRLAAEQNLQPNQFRIPPNPFISEVSFIQRTHEEGNEQLEVQPYYLRSTRQFGYLVDFHFRLNPGIPFSRKVQQLSLSLDRAFKRNLDYYIDRDSKLNTFLGERKDVFSALTMPGTNAEVCLASDFVALSADRLRTKTYLFGGNRDSRSQFTGLRDYGPLKPLDGPPRLLFVFREQDRHAARLLARGLQGSGQRQRYAFPGFKALFKSELEIDGNPIVLPSLDQQSMKDALTRVQADLESYPNTLPVVVLPSDDDAYLVHKALFTEAVIPTQVCTLRVLQDEGALKWAIANIALQVFCKAGGFPWKVRPAAAERTLIVGVSQSHKLREVDGKRQVEKYFAFSVLTDSSGLFQKIQVLGESDDQADYLTKLRQNLKDMLSQNAGEYQRVVVHTSFKLKRTEIDAIQKTVRDAAASPELSECQFAVVKVNHTSRFFGTNRSVNSLVPFEATRVRLGPGEYLVWFEGIFPDRTTVSKAFPGPTHLKMLRVSDEQSVPHEALLQDLVNLSGANWRGFNAKSAPVSVFYCHLVADMVRSFHEQGLPLPAVQDIRPWFL